MSLEGVKIIAITGVAGSGKSEASKALIERGYTNFKFARVLKKMTETFLIESGYLSQDADMRDWIEGENKNNCITPDNLRITPRYVMQTLGTEWGRMSFGDDFWVNILENEIMVSGAKKVVIDDLRFENEAAWVKSMGGVVVKIIRPNAEIREHHSHVSEKGVHADMIISNDGDLEDLRLKIANLDNDNMDNLATQIYLENVEVGWWEKRYAMPAHEMDMLIRNLIHSEISESLEGYRKNLMDSHLPIYENFYVELADTVIRSLDYLGYLRKEKNYYH